MSQGSQGVTHTRNYKVGANTVIVPGEFLIHDSANPGEVLSLRAVSAASWAGEVPFKVLGKQLFAGIALGASVAGDTASIPVAVAGRYTMPSVGTVNVSARVGFAKDPSANQLLPSSVTQSVNPLTTIGRAVRSEQIPTGTVTFEFDATADDLAQYTNVQTLSGTDTPSGTKNLALGRMFAGSGIVYVKGAHVTSTATAAAGENLVVTPQIIPFTKAAGAGTAIAVSGAITLDTAAARMISTSTTNPANAIRAVDDETTFTANMQHVYTAGGGATPIAGLQFAMTFIAAPNY